MQQSILFKVPGKPSTSPIVILTGPALGAQSANHFAGVRKMLSRALSRSIAWAKCNCTPRSIVSALFSAKVSMAVGAVCVAAIWWHNISIADTIEAQEAVGLDCLLAMTWGIVWAVRATFMPLPEDEEGGVQ